jgi:heme-binding NEAT domain protein
LWEVGDNVKYSVNNSQTISIGGTEGERTLLAVKVRYEDEETNIDHTKVFEFDVSISDADIQAQIEQYGRDLKTNTTKVRVVALEGSII